MDSKVDRKARRLGYEQASLHITIWLKEQAEAAESKSRPFHEGQAKAYRDVRKVLAAKRWKDSYELKIGTGLIAQAGVLRRRVH